MCPRRLEQQGASCPCGYLQAREAALSDDLREMVELLERCREFTGLRGALITEDIDRILARVRGAA